MYHRHKSHGKHVDTNMAATEINELERAREKLT